MDSDDDEEDGSGAIVVQELDVYFTSPPPNMSYYLLQYPMQERNRHMSPIVGARIKPKNKLLEVTREIDTDGIHYNKNASERLRLTNLTHSGTYIQPVTSYAIGIVRNGDLHLSPLEATMQMRPSFDHLLAELGFDEGGVNGEEKGVGGGDISRERLEKREMDGVEKVIYKKKETDRTQAARRSTYKYKLQKEGREPWIDLETRNADHEETESVRKCMLCPLESEDAMFSKGIGGTFDTHYNIPHPHCKRDCNAGSEIDMVNSSLTSKSNIVSHDHQMSGSLPFVHSGMNNLMGYVCRAGIISHVMLKELSGVTDDNTIISVLQQSEGVNLLRGNWVAPSLDVAVCEGNPWLCRARDLIMVLLQMNGFVLRTQIQKILRETHPDSILIILEGVAILDRRTRCWVPKLPDCPSFVSDYPRVAYFYDCRWRNLENGLKEDLNGGNPFPLPVGFLQCPFIAMDTVKSFPNDENGSMDEDGNSIQTMHVVPQKSKGGKK